MLNTRKNTDESLKEIFKSWCQNAFIPIVGKYLKDSNLPRKALLMLGNAFSHQSTDEHADGDIQS